MIVRATEHVEAGRFKSPYRHLLVDEFQDISEGRARLLKESSGRMGFPSEIVDDPLLDLVLPKPE